MSGDRHDVTNEPPEDDDVQLSACGATPCCDPRQAPHRFTVLIFICFLSFGKCTINKKNGNLKLK